MTTTAPSETLAPPAPNGVFAKIRWHWLHNPKIVLWVVWWTIPLFYVLYGYIYFGMANTMPPPPATFSADDVANWTQARTGGIQNAYVILYLIMGLPSFHQGLIFVLMQRMSTSQVYAYAYLATMCIASLPGSLLNGIGYNLILLRPDRDPEATMFLYDFANLTFCGSMGVFAVASFILCVAILFDKNKILPKWFGYACVLNATTEFTVATCWILRDETWGWNGAIPFYWNMVIYMIWQVAYMVVFYNAIKQMPATRAALSTSPERALA